MLKVGREALKGDEEAVKSDAVNNRLGSVYFLVKIKLKKDITSVKIYDSTFNMTFNHQKPYFLNFDLRIYFSIFRMSLASPNKSPQMDSLFKIT